MRFVSAREFRIRPGRVWADLKKERDLVVTSQGKPIAILSRAAESSLEQDLAALRRARALSAVDAVQRRSTKLGLDRLSLADINKEIRAARRDRRG
jgi:hypothetical protein